MAQDLVLREEACDDLVEYTTIPLSFLVDRVFRVGVPTSESEVVQLDEVPCLPHWKDYDEEDGDVPTDWSARFDTSNWRIFSAWSGEKGRDTECERARLPLLRALWIRTPPCCGRCISGTPR